MMIMKRGALVLCWLLALSAPVVSAVDLTIADLDGNVHSLDDYKGKWVIVNFWSTTCAPCLKEIPELSDFHRRHKDNDAVVLGINFEDIKPSWLREFVTSIHMNYPVLLWGTDPSTPLGEIMILPTTYIISPTGKLMGRQRGAVTAAALDKYLEQQNGTQQRDESQSRAGSRSP